MKRRGLVLTVAACVIGALAAIGYGIASSHSPDDSQITVSLTDLKDVGVLKIDRAQDIFLIWHDQEVLALSADAQHVGDDVVFCESSRLFESPSHGEKFDVRGFYYAGPGERGLDRYRVQVEGDEIFIDLDAIITGPDRGEGPPLEPEGPFCIPI